MEAISQKVPQQATLVIHTEDIPLHRVVLREEVEGECVCIGIMWK